MDKPADPLLSRRRVYMLLITVAVAAVCGRILSANRVYEPDIHRTDPGRAAGAILAPLAAGNPLEAVGLAAGGQYVWRTIGEDEPARLWPRARPEPTPMFGSNDRSRWATIRALVENHTYAVGDRDPARATPRNPYGNAGIIFEDGWQTLDVVLINQTFYSSKPPLLSTLVAGEYWLMHRFLGLSIVEDRWTVVRTTLLTVNALPFLIYLLLLARLIDRFGTTDWGRLLLVGAACFGTYLGPFAITLNNHTIAACSGVFALLPALSIWERDADALHGGAPAYRYALAGLFASFAACTELPATSFAVALFGLLLVKSPGRTLAFFLPAALLPVAGFFVTNYLAIGQWTPAYGEFGGPMYEYPGSHWKREPGVVKRGIDFAAENKAVYAFHLLLGHHGLLSLTPVFVMSLVGAIWLAVRALRRGGLRRPVAWVRGLPGLEWVAGLTLVLTGTVVGFYVYKTNNYGGWTSGPRWFMWLTPLLLLAAAPAADWLAGRRWGRGLGLLLLGLSVLSVSYPAWNPWRHPWIYNLLEAHGWVRY